jgi:hypothetical protein
VKHSKSRQIIPKGHESFVIVIIRFCSDSRLDESLLSLRAGFGIKPNCDASAIFCRAAAEPAIVCRQRLKGAQFFLQQPIRLSVARSQRLISQMTSDSTTLTRMQLVIGK